MGSQIAEFIEGWQKDPLGSRKAFLEYKKFLDSLEKGKTEFVSRPGVSFSLRGLNPAENKIFALVDVVDDEPDNRWLSVCFYAAMVTDPDERGDFVPQGLMGEDALCFNLDEDNPEMKAYILNRLQEAAKNSGLL